MEAGQKKTHAPAIILRAKKKVKRLILSNSHSSSKFSPRQNVSFFKKQFDLELPSHPFRVGHWSCLNHFRGLVRPMEGMDSDTV